MQGLSSGGIMAFHAAFTKPEEFSRVLSWIGSYTALRRSQGHPEGGGQHRDGERAEVKGYDYHFSFGVGRHNNGEDKPGVRAGSGREGSAGVAGRAVEPEVTWTYGML